MLSCLRALVQVPLVLDDLAEGQLDGSLAAEDLDEARDLLGLDVDLRDGGVERGDRPPSAKDWERLRAAASAGLGAIGLLRTRQVIVTGGTATNLLRLLPSTMLDREIAPEDLLAMGKILSSERATEIARTRGISNRRARMLPAGLSILEALLTHTTASVAVVDRGGIREGLVVALARSGPRWRSDLADLVGR